MEKDKHIDLQKFKRRKDVEMEKSNESGKKIAIENFEVGELLNKHEIYSLE